MGVTSLTHCSHFVQSNLGLALYIAGLPPIMTESWLPYTAALLNIPAPIWYLATIKPQTICQKLMLLKAVKVVIKATRLPDTTDCLRLF